MAQKLLDTASLLLNIECEVTFALPCTYLRFSTHFERNGLRINRRWEGRNSRCVRCTFFHTFFDIGNSWALYSHRRSVHAVIVTLCVGQHYVNCHFHIIYVPEAEIAFGTVPILRRVRLWTRVLRFTAGARPAMLATSVSQWLPVMKRPGPGHETDNRVFLVPGLRMCGAESIQIYIPSWPSQRHLYLSRLCNIHRILRNKTT